MRTIRPSEEITVTLRTDGRLWTAHAYVRGKRLEVEATETRGCALTVLDRMIGEEMEAQP